HTHTHTHTHHQKSKHHELHLVEKCVIVMLLRADAVDNMTRMVLVNAIYFKGTWDQPFPNTWTYKRKSEKTVIKEEELLFYSDIQFLVFLHRKKQNQYRSGVDLPRQDETLSGPQFKLEESYDLKEVLSSMGMKDAFDETKCDLTGMSGCKELILSKVSHKAFVEVNEEGTEAAAATTCCIELHSLPPKFTANHPFLFFICHNATMSVLFAGRFCSPK
uniref:Serpin B6 n=1 Tax=Fundulus heteroclitus TaxID=8078 RepID=A0A3Q2QTQ9_FUNHE